MAEVLKVLPARAQLGKLADCQLTTKVERPWCYPRRGGQYTPKLVVWKQGVLPGQAQSLRLPVDWSREAITQRIRLILLKEHGNF